MTSQAHVIGRQVLELELESERDAYAFPQEVGELFRTKVLPAMEALFDRCVPADVVLRLDRLEIDLGRLSRDRLEVTLATRVCEALEARLTDHLNAIPTGHVERREERLSRDDHVLALWHFVLRHGRLPWWAPHASVPTLQSRVLEVLESRDSLPPSTERLLREHQPAIPRVALQSEDALLERVLHLAAADVAAVTVPAFQALARLVEKRPVNALRAEVLRRHLWQAALEESLHPTALEPQARLRALLRSAFGMSARSASIGYAVFISQLEARLQPAASQSAEEIPAEIREMIQAALSQQNDAEHGLSSDDVLLAPSAPRAETLGDWEDVLPSHETKARPDVQDGRPLRPKPGKTAVGPPDDSGASATHAEETGRTMEAPRADSVSHPRRTKVESADAVTRAPLVEAEDEQARTRLEAPGGYARQSRTEIRREAAVGERDALFVDDAGIVLFHPFLAAHFEKLGLQRDGAFLDDDTRERAVHQLRFLATGEEEAPEPLLVFEKIMCGLTPDAPIARWVPLDESAKSEADKLLRAVIRHWGALKNTSPDGLRETFLRREGRLERKDDAWKLRVESRSYDLLLDRLPWPRSVVRLPWMAGLLWVEWA